MNKQQTIMKTVDFYSQSKVCEKYIVVNYKIQL